MSKAANLRWLYTNIIEKVVYDLSVYVLTESCEFSVNKVLESTGLSDQKNELVTVNPIFISEHLSQNRHRLDDLFEINTSYISALIDSSNTVNTINFRCRISTSIFTHLVNSFKKIIFDGDYQFINSFYSDEEDAKQSITNIDNLCITDICKVASNADLKQKPLITFTPLFVRMILTPAYKKTQSFKLCAQIIECGIKQRHADKYLGIKKTKLSIMRKQLGVNVKNPSSIADIRIKQREKIRSIYERDFGLSDNDTHRIFDIAKSENMQFSQVAMIIEAYDELYSFLIETQCSPQFASNFYNVPNRILSKLTEIQRVTGKGRNNANYLKSLSLEEIMTSDFKNSVARLSEICLRHNVSLDVLYSHVIQRMPTSDHAATKSLFLDVSGF